ncbi:MAG TPA: hypothetical protein ENJ02_10355 [Chloroflexi bacterium]|nr:hypothetical protein [Chloroflexota bacterium]
MPSLTRSQLLFLLETALEDDALLPQAEDLARNWLATCPGDLSVQAALARILGRRGQAEAARDIAGRLRIQAPCDPRPLRILLETASASDAQAAAANACLLALRETPSPHVALPAWGGLLAEMFRALEAGDAVLAALAERSLPALLAAEPPTPLLALAHLRLLGLQLPSARSEHTSLPALPAVHALLGQYRQRWPECLPLALWQAELYLAGGQEARAVEILHRAAAEDIGGEVPRRLWGEEHPYRGLWAQEVALPLDVPLPAELAALLGWNRLPAGAVHEWTRIDTKGTKDTKGTNSTKGANGTNGHRPSAMVEGAGSHSKAAAAFGEAAPPQRESAPASPKRDVIHQKRFASLHLPRSSRPVYLILTTRAGLTAQYGKAGYQRIWKALRALETALRPRYRGEVVLLAADDPESAARYEAAPAEAGDPWAVKLLLHDLNTWFRAHRQRIGAVLIVGGEKVVPFHKLPNPVQDDDPDVPSDAPYGSDDEDYFVGKWPVGRLPGDATARPAVLIRQIQQIVARQREEAVRQTRAWRLGLWMRKAWGWLRSSREMMPDTVGYTAAVWWPATLEVIRPVGSARDVLASPPTQALDFVGSGLYPATLGYFNLHGVRDDTPWYGQCDPRKVCSEDFPVALRPEDVGRNGEVPRIVFSEACYGGYLRGRALEQSVALQFLAHGTQALAASTALSYGSLRRPLIAADLLGNIFWNLVAGGVPAGEALRRAKIKMIAAARKRQDFLDAEDQKTLISFVLYGDPLAQVRFSLRIPKYRPERRAYLAIPAVADSAADVSLKPETVARVKQVVRSYLPGMEDAEWHYVAGRTAHAKGGTPQRRVIVLRKGMQGKHRRYARLTLDRRERLVRLSVSR